MDGASKASTAVMDGDNDKDVVAVSLLPAQEFVGREQQRISSAVLFEKTSPCKCGMIPIPEFRVTLQRSLNTRLTL